MDITATQSAAPLGLDLPANLPVNLPVDLLAGSVASRDPADIARVARDFESMFMSLVLKEMRQTLEPGSLFAGDNSDAYGGLFDMFMGKHLVEAGGFGVAKMLQQYLQNREHS